ncbi:MAG: response regulator transcription factor [Chromatiales bacterium]|nr:response regulator transcription factor [Chromatiales bacterium]
MRVRVLLVEDNAQLAESLDDFLSEQGFELDFAYNGQWALKLAKDNDYDVIVMDVMMPVMDGLAACRALRSEHFDNTPLIFLTARDTLADKLEGYDAGCDDYLVKPFSPEELVCRVNALLKRSGQPLESIQALGELEINHSLQQVFRQGRQIPLHGIQYELLQQLVKAAPEAVSRSVLEQALWPDEMPDSDPLRTHIYRLRQALDKPFDRALIETVHGRGYRLAIPH